MRTLGPEVGDFMRMVGAPLLPWQQHVMDVAFGVRADGKWAAYEVAIWLARQNGKGRCTEAQELFGAYMLRERKIIHSAHEFDTAGEAFDRLVEIIENCDWLRRRTAKIVRGKGSEGIQLTRAMGGGEIRFKARTDHGARGFTGDRIVLDEAYALTVAQFKAMSPTLATIPNCQITYTSSPPDDKTGPMPEDALTPSIRARGLSGAEPRLASFEWSPPPGFRSRAMAGDIDLWYGCNPSLGYLIDEEFLHGQFRIFDSAGRPEAYATEHLGLWPDTGSAQWLVIPRDDWSDASDPDSERPSPVAFAITVSADQQWATIAQAGPRPDGLQLVSIVDRREGTGWVLERLKELRERWSPVAIVVDKGSPAAAVATELEEAGIELRGINAREVAAAAMALYDGVSGVRSKDPDTGVEGPDPRVVRHGNQQALNDAVAAAQKRMMSHGSTWTWADSGSPLAAVSNALWGYRTRPVDVDQPFFAAWR